MGPDPHYTGIAPFLLPGGLGPHKWLDRRLVDGLAAAAGGALPLLIDTDGSVLEATWANVLIEERGRLISPPDDGRALPGIGRRALPYDEEPVDLDRLLAADAVVLTSALRVIRVPRNVPSAS
jgi:para-aminobenzoate synthetase/4-amino-4-deoxychorismate lyase